MGHCERTARVLAKLLFWVVEKEIGTSVNEGELGGPRSFEELARQQGVSPVHHFDSLLGKPFPGDESVDEFQQMLREWRRDGTFPERLL